MKICSKCGRIYDDSLIACDRCGWTENDYCQCGSRHEPGAVYCSMCGKKIMPQETAGLCGCGVINPPGALFCRGCGRKLAATEQKGAEENFCSCGMFNPINAVYCKNCGKKIKKITCPSCGQIMNSGSVCAYCGQQASPFAPISELPPVPKNPVGWVIALWVVAFCLLSAVCFFI